MLSLLTQFSAKYSKKKKKNCPQILAICLLNNKLNKTVVFQNAHGAIRLNFQGNAFISILATVRVRCEPVKVFTFGRQSSARDMILNEILSLPNRKLQSTEWVRCISDYQHVIPNENMRKQWSWHRGIPSPRNKKKNTVE